MENIKPLESSDLKDLVKKYSPFLVEVRKRIIFTFFIFAITTIIGFAFYEKIIKFLIGTLSLEGVNIVFTSPFQFINLAIACGLATGLIFTFPLILFQFFSFLKPALKKREYRMILRLLPFSIILFLIGATFGALLMKWQIQIFLERSVALGIGNILDISQLLTVVLLTAVFLGIGFQFPIILLLLMRLGLVKREGLARKRLWIYLGSFVFALLLPLDSILADVLLALPLILLFEATLIFSRF